jgi:chaperonin GroES
VFRLAPHKISGRGLNWPPARGKRIEEEEKTKGGIIIPDTAKEKPQEGRVVAVGPGKHDDGKVIPLGVKTGDKILFGKYSGTEINIEGEEHLIMREDDILGVIEK